MRILAALLFGSTIVFAQSTDKKGCSADGSVVNSITGAPIARARVGLAGGVDDSSIALTDADGKWNLDHLPCDVDSIIASRPGFVNSQAIERLVSRAGAVAAHDVKIRLAPQSVAVGRVFDAQGDPIQNAQITVMASRVVNGLRRFESRRSGSSNDLGEYRIAGLTAGKYIFCASANNAMISAVAPVFFGEQCNPGSVDAGVAGAMDLKAGAEARVDFVLFPLHAVHVRGAISGGPPGVTRAISMSRRPPESGPPVALAAFVRDDGTFDVSKVTPGAYTLTATSVQQSGRFVARIPVDVGGKDVEGIQLQLEPPMSVTGTVTVVSATGRKIDKPQYTATLRGSGAGTGGTLAVWDQNKTSFTMNDVVPGSYRLGFVPPRPFYLRSATLGGRDIANSDVPIGAEGGRIDVIISDDSGTLEGEVSTDDGPAPASIMLLRDGAEPRDLRLRADANGHFTMSMLPPGEYQASAWDDITNVEYADPDWMRLHARGVSVSIRSGETAQVRLTIQNAPGE